MNNSGINIKMYMHNETEVFRRMVLNPDKMTDIHYDCSFSFETVFYRTSYSYCCCPCAYQHEYFDYLSDKDELDEQEERHIDEAMFERIVQNIADGRCPHANTVEPKYLTTSTVYTDHILAVSGSKKSLKRVTGRVCKNLSRIFHLHPYVNLVLKNSCQVFELLKDLEDYEIMQCMYPIRSKVNHNTCIVHLERLSLLECCARKGTIKGFQYLKMPLRPHIFSSNNVSSVFDLAFKYELKAFLDSLIVNGFKTYVHQGRRIHTKNLENRKLERLICAEAAIVYNHPKILDGLISHRFAKEISQMEINKLVFICLALQRAECRKVLFKHGFPEYESLAEIDQQNELFHILLHYSGCREEIVSIIKRYNKICLPLIDIYANDYQVHLNCLLNQKCHRCINRVEFIQLVTLREDIDLTKLKMQCFRDEYRELVELCLFSNFSNLDSLVDQTVGIYLESHVTGKIGGKYIMDAKEHFLFSTENFALNFILPLFIECGFPLKRNLIDTILHKEEVSEKLHPAETEYLVQFLECPRSLQLCCRDSLRRHFKNRQIHQFVSISNVPNKIKDFILLKTVLPTLENTGFKPSDERSKDLP